MSFNFMGIVTICSDFGAQDLIKVDLCKRGMTLVVWDHQPVEINNQY